jgi:uncharacterized flavoprotein (TIGR03862 family)
MARVRVVGAGPAGLMAAEVLSSAGHAVTIIDHHKSPARKFLLAGRGGLNLTHSEPLDALLDRYGPDRAFLEPAIRSFPPDALRAWCASLGIETFVGSTGRVFPVGLKASPLLRAWLRRLWAQGVTLQSSTTWQGFDDHPTILAMGGASWPELGSDAAWVPLLVQAGIAITPMRASNARQRVAWSPVFAQKFKGQPLKNIAITCEGKTIRGEAMIAEDGIEGGAIYALSRHIRETAASHIVIDLKPDLSQNGVDEKRGRRKPKESLFNAFRKTLNLSPQAINLMREASTQNPKRVVVNLVGEPDVKRAISTAGGIAMSEVNEHFALHKYSNTHVVGEMLDWDAPTGGYLLQACFATARFAAADLASRLI